MVSSPTKLVISWWFSGDVMEFHGDFMVIYRHFMEVHEIYR